MRILVALGLTGLFSMLLAVACAPPLTVEQMDEYNQYVALRATEVAAAQAIAAAKATEAAAAQQMAQLTAQAGQPPLLPTATVTPTISSTATVALSATAVVTPTSALTTTTALTITPAITAGVVISGVAPAPALPPTAPITSAVAVTATPTAAVAPTAPPPTATLTVTATVQPTSSVFLRSWPSAVFTATTAPAASALPVTPTPTPRPAGTALVSSSQINVRGGPGTEFDVIGTAGRGAVLDVFGRDEGQGWWQVCCVDGKPGWVSKTVVTFQGDAQAVPVATPLMPDDLQASWALRWECHAQGCKQEECLGESLASTLRVRTARWLEVKREANWEDQCGEREEWLSQVDRYSGQEQQGSSSSPLFKIWAGANPGPVNRVIDLANRKLALWCTDTRTREVGQANGWTVVYEGQACYDTSAGVLVTMQYVKRWLFSGAYEGQTYDRQYFGDYEVYQQILTDTNAPLSGE